MQQELWAVDLDLNYSDTQVMFGLMDFVTSGTLDPKTHYFDIPPPKKEEKKTRRRRVKEEDEVGGALDCCKSLMVTRRRKMQHKNLG